MENSLEFNQNKYQIEILQGNGQSLEYRAFRHICYVKNPVDAIQCLSIYVPEAYYRGEEINGYNLRTAPVFLPNTVGGYMPGPEDGPRTNDKGDGNTIYLALLHGYVVVSAGVRGRSSVNQNGKYIGAAPAVVCDMKAAVRYLRYNTEWIPGNTERIITNGTSAGGALSALMGATGNHPDFEPYLEEMGAADASDEIYAASCYCPITNLDHADMAYEWEFGGMKEYHGWTGSGVLNEQQELLSKKLAKDFPAYVNSLHLKEDDGQIISLDKEGKGSFQKLVESFVVFSAQKELEKGTDLSGFGWLRVEDGRVISANFPAYIQYRTRMKATPAFDNVEMGTPENELFGTENIRNRHFTRFTFEHSNVSGALAEEKQIKMMNPMYYIEDEKAVKAKHYRIRHGAVDRDTSLAIPAILHTKLLNAGVDSDLAFPWGMPHAGDYDLDELFAWIDKIV